MRSSARRLGAVVVSTTLIAGAGAAVSPAQAADAPSNRYSQAAATWLAGEVPSTGLLTTTFDGVAYPDYGLSLDAFFGLHAVGGSPATQTEVLDAMASHIGDYTGTGSESYSGALGKLTTAVTDAGRDAGAFGGQDLVTRLEGLVHTAADAEQGRAIDASQYGDYSNTIGQTWAVRALAGNDSGLADEASAFLVKQQCAAGFFRVQMGDTGSAGPFTCDAAASPSPSVDTTAFAVEALVAARDAGVPGLDDEITKAGAWLAGAQASDGSFGDGGTANSNSTGLAAAALEAVGRTASAARAGTWVAGRTATTADAALYPKLSGDVGGIAYSVADFSDGASNGITAGKRDQWRRATAQALVGLDVVQDLTITAPTGYVHAGSPLTLNLSGLDPAEGFKIAFGSTKTVTGTASATGTASVDVTPAAGTRTYVVSATSNRWLRIGETSVKALGAKTLTIGKRSTRVAVGKIQRVRLMGLAPHEPAYMSFKGKQIFSGRADSKGEVVKEFNVGRETGVKTVYGRGQFGDRTGRTTFTIVR